MIAAAVDAARAGASILHIHARTLTGEMTQVPEDYLAIKQAIREQVEDVVLNFTTGGQLAIGGQLQEPDRESRRAIDAGPELATVNCGSMNFGSGDDVLLNPRSLIAEVAEELAERGIVPEYECFDIGMALTAAKLADAAKGAPGMMHMILGVDGGAPASAATVSLFAGACACRRPVGGDRYSPALPDDGALALARRPYTHRPGGRRLYRAR